VIQLILVFFYRSFNYSYHSNNNIPNKILKTLFFRFCILFMYLWKISPKSVHSELRNDFLKIFACRHITKMAWKASTCGLSWLCLVVISKTRDVYFAGSLVKQKLSMVESSRSVLIPKIKSHYRFLCIQLKILQFGRSWVWIPTLKNENDTKTCILRFVLAYVSVSHCLFTSQILAFDYACQLAQLLCLQLVLKVFLANGDRLNM